ncbi:Cysteine-rich receptor-like protein kinase 29 [Morus notabilis]|uniref:Cysteine-rich receptor-like protein kinase 29 n=1 Tax=Morus notabilis TaxID=981085 RepID=W9R4X3_9ROSA|nr:putative receptor-like protein kinase At4g00960 [Morus notabilis]EXB38211.1 Cysteine-rich receptor-like protein kinase 29 [Morus notabilis]
MARLLSSSSSVVIFFIHFQILLITQAIAQPDFLYHFCENHKGNYPRNSTYESNLNHLLSILPSQGGNGYGFYYLPYGNSSNQVYAIGLCRGDANPDVCVSCLNNATQRLPQNCPNQKEAVGWYDYCMLRYSNRSMFGVMETSLKVYLWNTQNVSSNVDEFFSDLRTLLDGLKNRAASGSSLRKFATGNASAPDFQTLYALVQCTPDLSKQDCNNCLDDAFDDIPTCCDNKIGGRVIGTNCNFRYEIRLFYNQTDDAPLASSPPPSTNATTTTGGNESNTSRTTVIIAVVSSAAVALVLIISVCVFLKKRGARKIDQTHPVNEPVEEIESVESLQYSFETTRVATDNFSEANKLGQGGFGSVYRGKLPNGQDIAVKRLSRNSNQGDLEFKNEVLLVAKLQHRNLVRLLGFCLEGSERLLVYEFVPNASLDHFIFDPSKRANLDWERRYKIIGGIARGLLYLHEDSRLRVIHRDLKASNILLDKEMHPKISDFGMARLFVVDQTQGNTNRIVGTYGYMAPEYAMHGHFSVRTDVFSFGVLLLEIVSGQKNNCFRHGEHVEDLLSYAWRNWRDRTASNIIDPLVRVNSVSEIMRYIHIGLLCVQENVAHRPTMNTVVLMLNSNSLSLPVPTEPAFFMNSNIGSDMALASEFNSRTTESDHSESKSVNQASANEASISELYPR